MLNKDGSSETLFDLIGKILEKEIMCMSVSPSFKNK